MHCTIPFLSFFLNDPSPPEIYTLSLHDALPISRFTPRGPSACTATTRCQSSITVTSSAARRDRKSTRLNSSHVSISYAVFCLKKKKYLRKFRISDRLSPHHVHWSFYYILIQDVM